MLDKNYWEKRYIDNNTPWDTGTATTPIMNYLKTIKNKDANILFPGAGRAHNAIHAYQSGFKNVYICDWADSILEELRIQHPFFPENQLINGDFFELSGTYDYIIEQTFFCALQPDSRKQYIEKSAELLKEDGVLAGLLFAIEFEHDGPPFGGRIEEYQRLFSTHFNVTHLDIARDSIKPRRGNEAFIIAQKK